MGNKVIGDLSALKMWLVIESGFEGSFGIV